MTAPFATALLGWKPSGKNKLDWPLVPNVADVDNAESMRIAAGVLDALGVTRSVTSDVPKDPGGPLEQAVHDHLRSALAGRGALAGHSAARDWLIGRGTVITRFDQYAHLKEVHALVRARPQLRISVGMDYLIKPDVTVGLGWRPRPGRACRRCTRRSPVNGRSARTGCRTSGMSACR